MTRAELTRYIFDTYSVEPDYPFPDDNVSAVFRHPANRKWFALAMNIPARRLGLPSDARMDIVNLKCDPRLSQLFQAEYPEVLPGFYCDKKNWIAALLDGDLPDQVLRDLCAQSYRLVVSKLPKYVQRELGGS